jgi:hypothetical protein
MHAFMSNRAEATAPDERAQSARRAARARRTRALDALDANSSWAMRDIRAEGAALTEAATSNDEDTRDLNADLIVLTHPFLEIQVKSKLLQEASPTVLGPQTSSLCTWAGHTPMGLPKQVRASLSISDCTVEALLAFVELAEIALSYRALPRPRRVIQLGQISHGLLRRYECHLLLAAVRAAARLDPLETLAELRAQGVCDAPVFHKTFADWDLIYGQATGHFITDAHLTRRSTGERILRRCVHWAEHWKEPPSLAASQRLCAFALLRALVSLDEQPESNLESKQVQRNSHNNLLSPVDDALEKAAARGAEQGVVCPLSQLTFESPPPSSAGLVAPLPRAWAEYELLLGRAAELRAKHKYDEERRLMGSIRRLGFKLGREARREVDVATGRGGAHGGDPPPRRAARTLPPHGGDPARPRQAGAAGTLLPTDEKPLHEWPHAPRRASSTPRSRRPRQQHDERHDERPYSPRPCMAASPRASANRPSIRPARPWAAALADTIGDGPSTTGTRGSDNGDPVARAKLGDLGRLSFELPTLTWTG